MVRTVRARGIREGSEGHYNLNGALLSLSPSLGVEWEKSDTTEWIGKHLLISLCLSLVPPEDNALARILFAQELLTGASLPICFLYILSVDTRLPPVARIRRN